MNHRHRRRGAPTECAVVVTEKNVLLSPTSSCLQPGPSGRPPGTGRWTSRCTHRASLMRGSLVASRRLAPRGGPITWLPPTNSRRRYRGRIAQRRAAFRKANAGDPLRERNVGETMLLPIVILVMTLSPGADSSAYYRISSRHQSTAQVPRVGDGGPWSDHHTGNRRSMSLSGSRTGLATNRDAREPGEHRDVVSRDIKWRVTLSPSTSTSRPGSANDPIGRLRTHAGSKQSP